MLICYICFKKRKKERKKEKKPDWNVFIIQEWLIKINPDLKNIIILKCMPADSFHYQRSLTATANY
jgi:hypothetical protein